MIDTGCDLYPYAGMGFSSGFRANVGEFIRSDGSKSNAGQKFKVGKASVHRWLKPGGLEHTTSAVNIPANRMRKGFGGMLNNLPL